MKYRVTLFLLVLSKIVISQNKEIIIKTSKLLLNQKKVDLFINPNDMGSHQENKQISSIIFGKIRICNYSEDSFCLYIQGFVPIQIIGLKNLSDNKIIIKNVSLVKYNPIDSISTYSVKYYNKDSLDLSTEKTTSYVPNNSSKLDQNRLTQIRINNELYYSKIISFPNEGDSWYCTPGKVSYNQYIRKVDKFYLFEIKKR